MITRFKTCLTNPKNIGKYKNDNVLKSIFYILLLSALIVVPSIIMVSKSKGVKESTIYSIRRMLVENKEQIPTGEIVDGILKMDKTPDEGVKGFFVGNITIILGNDQVDSLALALKGYTYIARLNDRTVDLYYISSKIDSFTYEELGLANLDFDFISNNDKEGFNLLEKAYVKIVNETEGLWKPQTIIFDWLSSFLGIIILGLFYALMSKIIRKMPYKYLFNISLYSLSVSVIFVLLSKLYNLYFLSAIGGIVGLFYLVIALRNVDTTVEEE